MSSPEILIVFDLSGTAALRSLTGCQTIIARAAAARADLLLDNNDQVNIGLLHLSLDWLEGLNQSAETS